MSFVNTDLLQKIGRDLESQAPPQTLDGFEDWFTGVFELMKSLDLFGISGIAVPLTGEGLTSMMIEMMAASNDSRILTPPHGNVTILTSSILKMFGTLQSLISKQIIDSSDLGVATDATALDKWLNEKSIFLRHWSATIPEIRNRAAFKWNVGPFVAGTFGGYSLGVYRYSKNIDDSVRVVKWMSSREYQKMMANAPIPAIPTYSDLYDDEQVCQGLGLEICKTLKNVRVVLKPSMFNAQYANLSSEFSQSVSDILENRVEALPGLIRLDSRLREIMHQNTATNINIGKAGTLQPTSPPSGKRVLKNVGTQIFFLLFIIGMTVSGVLLNRHRILRQKALAVEEKQSMMKRCESGSVDSGDKFDEEMLGASKLSI